MNLRAVLLLTGALAPSAVRSRKLQLDASVRLQAASSETGLSSLADHH